MREGYYIGPGDKTTCSGTVLDGDPRVNIYGLLHACEGDQVTCGKHKGIYKILGGISPIESHGRRMAGTLDSFSSCPCRAKFIPSVYTATYSNEGYEVPATGRAVEPASSTLTGRPDTPQQSTYAPSHTLAPSGFNRLPGQEPGFYVVPKSMSREALENVLFPAPDPDVMRKFQALNPKTGDVKAGAMAHVEAISRAVKYMKTGGYIGIGIGGVSSLLAIQQVCNGGSSAACEKVKFTEGGKFGISTAGGALVGGMAKAASGPICLALGVSTGLGGVVCVAAVIGAGTWLGTTGGGMAGEHMGEKIYEMTQP
ncbi:MAG: PAAR domain-containing protein [Pseudomonas sp.]|uniref:PAAR domain-containing protein n=1 Tax=Pseudomonas sp. TaxID=306 RepID=UPI00391D7094